MARARNIKPGFFKNEDLAECSAEARLLFIGLWLLADREGRLEDRPKRIRAELFPYNDYEVDKLLNELHDRKFIVRYTAEDQACIEIFNFVKHQNPHPKEAKSELPASKPCTATEKPARAKKRNCSPCKDAASSAESLISDSPSTETPNSESTPVSPLEKGTDGYSPAFLDFWEIYPNKVGKDKAFAAWKKAIKRCRSRHELETNRQAIEHITTKASEFAPTPLGQDTKYCPHPTTWLNGGRYDDDPQAWQRSGGSDRPTDRQIPEISEE
jgi:hypothetical protein